MTDLTFLVEKESQPFQLMKLPSPVRRRIYEFIILASDDPFENDADSVKITRFVRYPEDPTLRLYQLWTGKWDRYLQLNDGPPLYPLAYSSMSTGRIQNFAKILPEDESAEFQKLFWQSSVLSFTKVRATETASRDNPLLPPDFPEVGHCIRDFWPDANISCVRNLALNLNVLQNGDGRAFLLRLLRVRFELDSLTITWTATISLILSQIHASQTETVPTHLIKSIVVHKSFIFELRLTPPRPEDPFPEYMPAGVNLRNYIGLAAPWSAALRALFLPYTLSEDHNRPLLEHDDFGLDRFFKEELDERDYLNDREARVRETEELLQQMFL